MMNQHTCQHEWQMNGVLMPEGYVKPLSPSTCRKCGATAPQGQFSAPIQPTPSPDAADRLPLDRLRESLDWALNRLAQMVDFRGGTAYVNGIEWAGFAAKFDEARNASARRSGEARPTDEKDQRDREPRYSQYDLDAATKPLHAEIERLRLEVGAARPSPDLTTNDPRVVACMGSVPECAANGCQFRKTAGYRAGEGPTFPPVESAPAAPLCDCGRPKNACASCAVDDYCAEHGIYAGSAAPLTDLKPDLPERTEQLASDISKAIVEWAGLAARLRSERDEARAALATQQAALRAIQDALVEAFYDPDPVDPDPELDYGRVDWVGVVKDARKQIDKLKARLLGAEGAE